MTNTLPTSSVVADEGLLPCPFCGEMPYEVPQNIQKTALVQIKAVWCDKCKAQGPERYAELSDDEAGKAKAITAWNTRVASSVVADEELDAALEEILAKSDVQVMTEELSKHFKHFDRAFDDSPQFTRLQMIEAHCLGFEEGKKFIQMVHKAAAAASDRDVLVKTVEQEISAWAFAHDIDGAIRNELFTRIRAALVPLGGGATTLDSPRESSI